MKRDFSNFDLVSNIIKKPLTNIGIILQVVKMKSITFQAVLSVPDSPSILVFMYVHPDRR